MPSTFDGEDVTGHDGPVRDETTIVDLAVDGVLPDALSGRYLRIGPNPIAPPPGGAAGTIDDGMVHAVSLHAGRAISYRNRWITTDGAAARLGAEPVPGPRRAGPDVVATNLILFGGSILALGDGALAYEMTPDLGTLRRVDLAGTGRGLTPRPVLDPRRGDLHLLDAAGPPMQVYVRVSAGGMTRTIRPLESAPGRLTDLAVTAEHLVLLGNGFIGVTERAGDRPVTWLRHDHGCGMVGAVDDEGRGVVVHVAGPRLERWTVHMDRPAVDREVLDATPQRFGRINDRLSGALHRHLWTVGHHDVHHHDLVTGVRHRHHLGRDRRPGELLFVADPDRAGDEDGGWLIGFVHDLVGRTAQLVVLDAARISAPPVATVHIPRRIPDGRHGIWVPCDRPSRI